MGHDLEPAKALSNLLGASGLNLGEVATQLLARDGSEELRDLIQRCDLCGFCTRDCSSALNAGELFKNARALLVEQGKLSGAN